jgi:Na+-driven multidrug efflux pump
MVNALTASTPRIQLTEGPIARTLLWFALPILGGTLLQSLSASINAVWIGHFLGESALAATSNATLILFLLLNAVFGVSIAATILVGQALGASRVDEAKRVVGTGVGFITVISFAVAIVGYLTTPTLLRWLSTPIDAMEDAATYLRIIFIALPPICQVSVASSSCLEQDGARI